MLGVAQPRLPTTGPVYVHLLVVGWITQVIFGVAYWMFPRHSRDTPRGSAGLVLRVLAERVYTLHSTLGFGWVLAVSALLQWLGGMAFVVNSWPRVKGH